MDLLYTLNLLDGWKYRICNTILYLHSSSKKTQCGNRSSPVYEKHVDDFAYNANVNKITFSKNRENMHFSNDFDHTTSTFYIFN